MRESRQQHTPLSCGACLLFAPTFAHKQPLLSYHRITKDQNTIDVTTRAVISMFLLCVLSFANIVVVTAVTTPLALVMAIVLAFPYYVVTTLYRWSARDLSR